MDVVYLGYNDFSRSFIRKGIRNLKRRSKGVYKLPVPGYSIVGNTVFFDENINVFSLIGYFKDPREVNTYDENEAFPSVSEYKLELLSLQQLLTTKNIPFDIMNDGQRVYMTPSTSTRNRTSNQQTSK